MGLFGRISRLIKGWLLLLVGKAEDPEVILAEAHDAMQQEVAKAQEHAVAAIAAKNQLQSTLKDLQNQSAGLDAKARAALRSGDEELARQILVEKGAIDQQIQNLQPQLEQAIQASEAVKSGIKQMEARVRQRAAQRLALVAGWKQAQIQEKINQSLSGINLDQFDSGFTRAEERIRELQAKADARAELGGETNFTSRMAKLENRMADESADQALAAMKAEMGMASPVTADQGVDPLAELKAKVEAEQPRTVPVGRNIEV